MDRGFFALILRSWWVGVVLFVTLGLYADGMRRKGSELSRLQAEREVFAERIAKMRAERDSLREQVASQGDPAFVEMVLMRKLGLVPEEQTKVYFK